MTAKAFERVVPNYNIQWVSNGENAMGYLSGAGIYSDRTKYPFPEMMVLDMKLPFLSGQEILKWIKENKNLGKLWVVLLTGQALPNRPTTVMETWNNVTICYAELLKPLSPPMIDTMLHMFELWQSLSKGRESQLGAVSENI